MGKKKHILLTIDVEDWFQVENFKRWIPFETWDQHELRVERSVHQLLNLFDSIELKAQSSKPIETNDSADSMNLDLSREVRSQKKEGSSIQSSDNGYELSAMSYEKSHPKVTFFILGWIAERLPNLVREIHTRGHEIASHGYNHNLCNLQSEADLKNELTSSKRLLEDITGSEVFGFRAPNFSINDDSLKIIEGCGYTYDSSYNSFNLHGRYGKISLNGHSKYGIAHKISENFFELPISNLKLGNTISFWLSAISSGRNDKKRFVLPWGGGAYFRFIPSKIFCTGVENILEKSCGYVFYFHPWELDPEQQRLDNVSYFSKFKHYTNIRQTRKKLNMLLSKLSYCQFPTCSEYINSTL
jgi:polysaccharide deacetylase family protein (PEP-CTERM system associated)